MTHRSRNVIRYGRDVPLPLEHPLRAGPLSLVYSHGDLRAIRLGSVEVLNRVYVAVRDRNWNTIPVTLSNVRIEDGGDHFRVSFNADHRDGAIDFGWRGRIVGDADGTLHFAMEGAARSTFLRNRIGFCVLHPASLAGQPCTVEHVDGTQTASRFPDLISPHQPFFNIRAIRHDVIVDSAAAAVGAPRVEARVVMTGDTFEMEDQRNWTDASFKTYCTPLAHAFPVEIAAGTPVEQAVTLRLAGRIGAVAQPAHLRAEPLSVAIAGRAVGTLPQVGLGMSSEHPDLTEREVARLAAMGVSHLRVDLDLQGPWARTLQDGAAQAAALNCPLALALHLSAAADAELAAVAAAVAATGAPVAHWLIYAKDAVALDARRVDAARTHLGRISAAPITGGTDAYFTELNRNPPPHTALDAVCYSINPQVHAFDNRSLMETLPVQGMTVKSAHALVPGRPILVTPVTLRPRFNPNATAAEPIEHGRLPSQVDPRQMALFGAAWAVGSVKALAENATAGVTYFETVGRRGVMARTTAPSLSHRFPAAPGDLYPVYHVLALLSRAAGATVLAVASSDAACVTGLAFAGPDCIYALLANLTPTSQDVTVTHPGSACAYVLLDETSFAQSCRDAGHFTDTSRLADATQSHAQSHEGPAVHLSPYAVALLKLS